MSSVPTSSKRLDIGGRSDIARLLRAFYRRAFVDDLLGPVFAVAAMDLEAHLPVMCDFWDTVLFRTGTYRRNALNVHRDLHDRVPLTEAHFARWLEIWCATTDDLYAGPVAERAKLQARRIAGAMARRLAGRDEPGLPVPHSLPRAERAAVAVEEGARSFDRLREVEVLRDLTRQADPRSGGDADDPALLVQQRPA
jgi:hemoglobin